MNEYVCAFCGTPACLLLSASPALPSSSTVLLDTSRPSSREGALSGALPPLTRFCIVCGHELAFHCHVQPHKESAGSPALTQLTQRRVTASTASSAPRAAPTGLVSVATLYNAVVALTRQYQAERMMLQQEVDRLKAMLAETLERDPALSKSERAPAKGIISTTHSVDTACIDSDCDFDSHHARSNGCLRSCRSRTRSPSIVLPPYCEARRDTPSGEGAGVLAAMAENASVPFLQRAPPRCSRTLPRHSLSYDSSIADFDCAAAAAADAVTPTQFEPSWNSGTNVSLVDDEGRRRSAPLTQPVPFPVTAPRRSSDNGELDCRQAQKEEYARLRESLLQQL